MRHAPIPQLVAALSTAPTITYRYPSAPPEAYPATAPNGTASGLLGFSKSDWRLDFTADRSRNNALHYLEKGLMREKKLALLHLTSD